MSFPALATVRHRCRHTADNAPGAKGIRRKPVPAVAVLLDPGERHDPTRRHRRAALHRCLWGTAQPRGAPSAQEGAPPPRQQNGGRFAEALVRPGSRMNNPAASCSEPDRAESHRCFDWTGCRRRAHGSPHNRLWSKHLRATEKRTPGLKVGSAQSIRVCRLSRKGGIMAPRSSVVGLAGRVSLKLCGLGSGR